MSPLRLTGSTSGYSQLDAPAVAGDQTFTLPGTGGTLDRLNRAGNILQVVQGTLTTAVSTSSTTYSDLGLSASITPSSSSNKVLVCVGLSGIYKSAANANNALVARLLRGANTIAQIEALAGWTNTALNNVVAAAVSIYLDAPSTTSSITYKVQIANYVAAAAVSVNSGLETSSITLFEVAA